jgi:hypothetical protein
MIIKFKESESYWKNYMLECIFKSAPPCGPQHFRELVLGSTTIHRAFESSLKTYSDSFDTFVV